MAGKPYFAYALHKSTCIAKTMKEVWVAPQSNFRFDSYKCKNNPTECVFAFFNPYKTVKVLS